MMHHEKLEDYIYDMDSLCSTLKKNDCDRIAYFVRGLIPLFKTFVIQQQSTTWKEAVRLAPYSMSTSETAWRPICDFVLRFADAVTLRTSDTVNCHATG